MENSHSSWSNVCSFYDWALLDSFISAADISLPGNDEIKRAMNAIVILNLVLIPTLQGYVIETLCGLNGSRRVKPSSAKWSHQLDVCEPRCFSGNEVLAWKAQAARFESDSVRFSLQNVCFMVVLPSASVNEAAKMARLHIAAHLNAGIILVQTVVRAPCPPLSPRVLSIPPPVPLRRWPCSIKRRQGTWTNGSFRFQ